MRWLLAAAATAITTSVVFWPCWILLPEVFGDGMAAIVSSMVGSIVGYLSGSFFGRWACESETRRNRT